MKRLILLVGLCVAGCSAASDTAPDRDLTASSTAAAPSALAPTPTDTALPSNTATTVKSSQLPPGTVIEPLLTSTERLVALNWSPDGEWFAYRDYSTSYDYLYHLASDSICPLTEAPDPYDMRSLNHYAWDWLADSRLLVALPDGVFITEPCSDPGQDISSIFATHPSGIASTNPEHNLFVFFSSRDDFSRDLYLYDALDGSVWTMPPDVGGLDTGFSWSPGSTYLAMMGLIDPLTLPHKGRVWVMDVASGGIVRLIDVELWHQDYPYVGQPWINETQFVVPHTLDRSPFMVSMGGGITSIPERIFGARPDSEACDRADCLVNTFALTAGIADAGRHIVWEGPQRQMHHAETGEIEVLDFTGMIRFSPDGQWMLVWDMNSRFLHLRSVDPPGAGLIPLPLGNEFGVWSLIPFDWSPDSQTFAVAVESQRYVALYHVPDAREVGRWWAEDYRLGTPMQWSLSYEWIAPGVWSPDGKYLLLTGEGAGDALFLIQKP